MSLVVHCSLMECICIRASQFIQVNPVLLYDQLRHRKRQSNPIQSQPIQADPSR